MPAKRIDPRAIKLHRPYSVEAAALALGAHKHTIRNWIKQGLPTVDNSRPVLMHGHELRAFIQGKRKAAKRPCPPGTIYCFKCRQPRSPASGMIEYTPRNATTGNLTALCDECGTLMNRSASLASLGAIMPKLEIQIREAGARLIERKQPSLHCDKQKD